MVGKHEAFFNLNGNSQTDRKLNIGIYTDENIMIAFLYLINSRKQYVVNYSRSCSIQKLNATSPLYRRCSDP